MNVPVFLPVILPLAAAAIALTAWRSRALQQGVALIGSLCQTAAAIWLLVLVSDGEILVAHAGSWPAPFGISLVADILAAAMVAVSAIVGLATVIYSIASIDSQRQSFGYHPLVQVLLAGVCLAFLTGDIFNLYVAFEILLIASFVLMALGGERAQLEGALKYVTLNLISSAFFLVGVGILYGMTGALNMADLSQRLADSPNPGLVTTVAMLFLIAFGIKAAVFPLFFWLPASYHTPPAAVSAVFAGLLTKVGVYALIRVFTLLFLGDTAFTHGVLLVVAGLTMVSGVLGAYSQGDFRRILSFHIVSQIGYMIMGLALFTPLGLAASVFYLLHHIVVKTNLFFVSGIVHRLYGTGELAKLGGLSARSPLLAVLFLVPALSLAGLPPLSGFFAKLGLIQAGLEAESHAIVIVALAVSLVTLLSMMKIWAEVFWKPLPDGAPPPAARSTPASMLLPVAAMALITVCIGLGAQPVFALAERAAAQLLDPSAYVAAVLGSTP